MQKPNRKHSARLRKYIRTPGQAIGRCCSTATCMLQNALCTSLACLFAVVAPWPGFAAEAPRPGIGEACVFSCSLLHEATPVTAGVRYVFLPFLYDDAAAEIRQGSEQFLGGDVNERPV